MLGQDLVGHLRKVHQVLPLTRQDADIRERHAVRSALEKCRTEIVIHAAAFTAVDECERQAELAYSVNAEGTRNVALACQEFRLPMLYVSTDYVFDGECAAPYVEEDVPHPLNVYGRTKLEGETSVRSLLTRFWIVRTSWLYGPQGKNFVTTIHGLAQRGEALRVVHDQVGSPTYTMDLAEALGRVIERGRFGTYHVTNQGACSWYEFAREVLLQTGLKEARLSPIDTPASGRLARRPRNSQLANARLKAEGFPSLPSWKDALGRFLSRAGLIVPQAEPGRPQPRP